MKNAQFIGWIIALDGRKVPVSLRTGHTINPHDPTHWMNATEARALLKPGTRLGYVLTADDPYFFIDLDKCLQEDSDWSPLALEICAMFPGAYMEVSQSGKGLHIIATARVIPPHACKNTALKIELYHDKRFVALTEINSQGSVDADHTQAIIVLIDKYFQRSKHSAKGLDEWTTEPCPEWGGNADDNELIEAAKRSKSTAAAFGGKASFTDLWTANEGALARAYPPASDDVYDRSSADAALAAHLAFWTGRNCARIEQLMRQSALVRDKWEREDYMRRTILFAVAQCRDVHSGHTDQATDWQSPVSLSTASSSLAAPAGPRARRTSISDLFTNPPEPQRFLIDGILPGGVVTLLGAHGGTGKSILALMATACLVTGRPFMGKATEKCPVLFYSAEDPAPVIRRRLARICKHMDISPGVLSDGLLMLDATDSPTLYNGAGTPALAALRADVREFSPGVIIVDNASDTFDSNEIERARVREFIRLLASLGKENNAAVLLLAHIDKQTAKNGGGGEGYSGSTAWHNSARSRLFLYAKDNGLILEHQKSNLGRRSDPIYLQWTDDGLLAHVDAPGGTDDRATILRLIADAYGRGEFISPAPNASNNAYKVLQLSPGFPRGLSRQGLCAVIRELESAGMLTKENYDNGHRKVKQRYAASAAGVRQVQPAALNAPPTRKGAACVSGGVGDSPHANT